MSDSLIVKCPTCRKRGAWFKNKYGPFCSRRCKLVDLGQWFDGQHKISEPLRPDHFEDYGELPSGEHLDQTGD